MAELNPFEMPAQSGPEPEYEAPSQAAPEQPCEQPEAAGGAVGRFFRSTPKKVLIPSAIVIVLLLAFIFAGGAIMLRVAPAWSLGRASAETAKAVKGRFDQSPYKALALYWSAIMQGRIEGDLAYDDGWNELDLQFDLLTDLKKGMGQLGFVMNSGGQTVDAEVFLGRDNAAATSSVLNGQWYGATYDSFEADLRASALPAYLGMEEDDIQEAVRVVQSVNDFMGKDYKDLLQAYSAVFANFSKELKYETDTAETDLGGERTKCSRVRLEVSERQIRTLIEALAQTMAEDETLKDMMLASYMSDGWYTGEEAEAEYASWSNNFKQEAKKEMARYTGDLELSYYLYKDQLIKLVMTGEPAVDGEVVRLDFTMDFGRDPAKDDWSLDLTASDDIDSYGLELFYSSEESGGRYTDSFNITARGYDVTSMTVESDWDKASGDLGLDLDYGYGPVSLFANLQVGKDSFALDIPDLGEQIGLYEGGASLYLTAAAGEKLTPPDFLNLDRWDDTVMETFATATAAMMQ